MAKQETAVDTQQKQTHNKEYIEYKLEVTPLFRPQPGGGQYLHKYKGEILKKHRTGIKIEEFRATQLNAQWFNRKLILLEVGDTNTTFELIVKE